MKNYYQILNVSETASIEEIKEAYYVLMKMLHPDKYDRVKQNAEYEKANNYVKDLNEAYAILRDPVKRKDYDSLLHVGKTEQTKPNGNTDTKSSRLRPTRHLFNTTIDFLKLPAGIKEKLAQIINNESDNKIVIWEDNRGLNILLTIISIAAISVTALLTNDYLWSGNKKLVLLCINLISLILIAYNIRYFVKWNKSVIRPKTIVTPLYLIKCGFDEIYFRWLWDMDDYSATHQLKNNEYQNTTVKISYGKDIEELTISSKPLFDKFTEKLKIWSTITTDAHNTGNYEKMGESDYFVGVTEEHILTKKKTIPYVLILIVMGVFILQSVTLQALNKHYDDVKSWESALDINAASGYRLYIASHADGKWKNEAKNNIDDLYENAINKYESSVVGKYEEGAVNAIIYLLQSAKCTGIFEVPVMFNGINSIPTNVENRLMQEYNIDNILSVGNAFSDSRMKSRETQILEEIIKAFNKIIPGDILDLVHTNDTKSCCIYINYEIKESGLYYFTNRKTRISSKGPYYPGIIIDWKCLIKNNEGSYYSFKLKSKPAEHFKTTPGQVYDDMALTAFSDFRQEFINKVGLLK